MGKGHLLNELSVNFISLYDSKHSLKAFGQEAWVWQFYHFFLHLFSSCVILGSSCWGNLKMPHDPAMPVQWLPRLCLRTSGDGLSLMMTRMMMMIITMIILATYTYWTHTVCKYSAQSLILIIPVLQMTDMSHTEVICHTGLLFISPKPQSCLPQGLCTFLFPCLCLMSSFLSPLMRELPCWL